MDSTARGDCIAEAMRRYYEEHRESWWSRLWKRIVDGGVVTASDNLMIGVWNAGIAEDGRIADAEKAAAEAREARRSIKGLTAAEVEKAHQLIRDASTTSKRRHNIILDIISERNKQITRGYSAAHDDKYKLGELRSAAACFVLRTLHPQDPMVEQAQWNAVRELWPWAQEHWKDRTEKESLIVAAALIVAELERCDREQVAAEEAGAL